ncbi:MAG: hypothetical protein QOI09_2562 [Chloroflexota bacterium]|nr:hypothetical protein [Chloroflexota bacterium]
MARGSRGRRPWLLVVATVLATTVGLAPIAARPAAAAGDALTLAASTSYTVQPAKHVVRVVLDLTATNNKANTTAGGIVTRYFYQGARLAIQAEARNVRATTGGARLTATVSPADGYETLEVRFGSGLFYHQTTKVRITFDLPGGAPRSKSDIRVGSAFATFVAWAFGDTGSVRIVVPAGFDAATTGSVVTRATSAGATVFSANAIQDVGAWYAVVNADRQAGLTSDRIDLPGGEHLVVRAWPEDALWRKRVKTLLTKGLPELVKLTGLDWPVSSDLQIFEVHTPLLEGYAGVFFENQAKIEISEDLEDLTILHEASHAWFNRDLFLGRWLNEGFADAYAARALDALGSSGWAPAKVNPKDAAAIPLADWTTPGRITDAATNAREQYGYEASWTVIRSLIGEIGVDGMQTVLQAAKDRHIAYVGAVPAETVGDAVDWRRFLDLVDETAGSVKADDLFRSWVLNAADRATLDARAVARTAYHGLVDAGRGWLPPAFVRVPMSTWDFGSAEERIPVAAAILASRDQIAAVVAPLQIDPPAALRTAYESATDSLAPAQTLADSELAAARALVAAEEAAGAPRDTWMDIGLFGETRDANLAAARSAFQAGAADAADQADRVTTLLGRAAAVGQSRVIAGIGTLVVITLLLLAAMFFIPRRRPPVVMRPRQAHPLGDATADARSSYATLPDQSGEPDGRPADLPYPPVPPVPLDPPDPRARPPEDRESAP